MNDLPLQLFTRRIRGRSYPTSSDTIFNVIIIISYLLVSISFQVHYIFPDIEFRKTYNKHSRAKLLIVRSSLKAPFHKSDAIPY